MRLRVTGFALLAPFLLHQVTLYAEVPHSASLRSLVGRAGSATVLVTLDAGLQTAGTVDGLPEPATVDLARRKQAYRRCQDRCIASLAGTKTRVKHRYRYSPVLAIEISDEAGQRAIERLVDVLRIEPDRQGTGSLEESRPLIHADEVHELGIRGEGCVVAVLDSGVDSDHPDLADNLIYEHAKHFLNQGDDIGTGAEDGHGHGTNVSGIISSLGTVAPLGIAPSAKIIPVKVLDDRNNGWFSDWAAGLDYVIDLHEADNGVEVSLINMSLASRVVFPGTCDDEHDAIHGALAAARELGIPIFAASGNNNSRTGTSIPACMTEAFSIGSVEDSDPDEISNFTNRNSSLDLLAPGSAILSAGRDGGTSSISGTSQASPHAAAVACLMLEVDPTLSPERILSILQESGIPVQDPDTGLTIPRIDALAALGALLVPRVERLTCEYLPVSRELAATWPELVDTDIDGLSISITRNGELIHLEVLDRSTSDFSLLGIADGEYLVSLHAVSNDLHGLTSTCVVSAAPAEETFRRGDCDGDGQFVLSDAVYSLHLLFLDRKTRPTCWRACDSNDDGTVTITDAIYTLRALFQRGAQPPAPHLECGPDPTLEAPILECLESHCS